jgi:4'-phosphopantetheinyl transferase
VIPRGHVVVQYLVPERITGGARLSRLRAMLSADEVARMQRLRRPGDRQRFLVSHALVRLLLSRHAPVEPSDWDFVPGPHGKPAIGAPRDHAKLSFSLSHTDGLCACALTETGDVGIDVERLARRVEADALAARMLSPDEASRIASLDPERRRAAFLRHWTLREAWVKARGEGMYRVPREAISFRIAGPAGDEVEARFPLTPPGGSGEWRFLLRELEGSHLCAVAVQATGDATVVLDVVPLELDQPSGSSSSPL